MKLECCNNKPVVSCKELGTPENPAVLEDPPTSTNKDVINLLCYLSGIAIPSLAVQLWSLIPRTCILNTYVPTNILLKKIKLNRTHV